MAWFWCTGLPVTAASLYTLSLNISHTDTYTICMKLTTSTVVCAYVQCIDFWWSLNNLYINRAVQTCAAVYTTFCVISWQGIWCYLHAILYFYLSLYFLSLPFQAPCILSVPLGVMEKIGRPRSKEKNVSSLEVFCKVFIVGGQQKKVTGYPGVPLTPDPSALSYMAAMATCHNCQSWNAI